MKINTDNKDKTQIFRVSFITCFNLLNYLKFYTINPLCLALM